MTACDACLRRTWLVARLAGALEVAWRARCPIRDVLALPDQALIDALLPEPKRDEVRLALAAFTAEQARRELERARLTAVCRHDAAYPARLAQTADAPAVLHLAGDPSLLQELVGGAVEDGAPAAAVVGTRRASPDGLEIARALGRGIARAGVTVVSGMALGIDSAAHAGALEAGGPTVAVLAGGADLPTPRSKAALHRRLVEEQLVVSELPPGFAPYRWCFPARNRLIAGLAGITVVVEGAERSGSLITADFAAALGREVAAVPGRAASPRTRGSNGLLRDGATLVLDAEDVLDALFGPDRARERREVWALDRLPSGQQELLEAIASGRDRLDLLATTPEQADVARRGLVDLELAGWVRRAPGGRWVVRG